MKAKEKALTGDLGRAEWAGGRVTEAGRARRGGGGQCGVPGRHDTARTGTRRAQRRELWFDTRSYSLRVQKTGILEVRDFLF